MRRHLRVLAIMMVLAPLAEPEAAFAQFSPRALIGAITRPLRGLLGHHSARRHHSRPHAAKSAEPRRGSDEKQAMREDNAESGGTAASRTPADMQNPYQTVIGYAFWPDEFEDAYSRYGYRTITAAVIGAPAAITVSDAGPARNRPPTADISLPGCDIADDSASDWLAGRLEDALRSQPAQAAALEALRARLVAGAKAIRSHCRAAESGTPAERLAELQARLWALHEADIIARPAIKDFYDGLNEGQRRRFAAVPAGAARSGQRQRACAGRDGAETQRLIAEIARATRPTQAQRDGLENLREQSARMEKLLSAACVRPSLGDPVARLDLADDELVAMNFAASNLAIALNDYYGALDARQKAAFDELGR
jgi:hypothetical protein